jgi:transposase
MLPAIARTTSPRGHRPDRSIAARRTTKVAAVALANKTARVIWAIMTNGERYREPVGQAA